MRKAKRLALSSLIIAIILSVFSGTAFGASARYATAIEVVGTVTVMQAGGAKELRVYQGMEFHEGDRIKVGKGGSLTLKAADRDDEIVLGENWNGALSKLRGNADGSTETAIHTWTGTMLNSVQKLTGSNSSYQVETPTSIMSARGTNYVVTTDPVTGLTSMAVLSGHVGVTPPSAPSRGTPAGGSGVIVSPAQQVEVIGNSIPFSNSIDPGTLIDNVPPSVISSIIQAVDKIDQENREEAKSGEAANGAGSSGDGLPSSPSTPPSLDYFQSVLQQIINSSQSKLPEEEIQQLLEDSAQYSPNREVEIPEIPNVGNQESLEKQRQLEQARELQQQKQDQKQNQKEDIKQKLETNNQNLIEQIQQQAAALKEQNQKMAESKQQEAIEKLKSQLTDAQRDALDQRVQQKQDEKQQQSDAMRPTAPTTPTTGKSPGGGSSEPAKAGTTTTISFNKSEIYAGESVQLTARASLSGTGQPVPDGTTVTFQHRISKQQIATAETHDGVAMASLSPEDSLALFDVGDNYINAFTAGTSTTQSNTSLPVMLKVNKNETVTEVTSPEPVASVGDTVPFTVTVSPQHGQAAAVGTVKLYAGDTEIGSKPLDAEGTATFDVQIDEPASDIARMYRAVYVGTEKQAGSEGSAELTVVPPEAPGLATKTSITVHKDAIYAGESVELTANVSIMEDGRPVPDGTEVTFRDHETKRVIGTAFTDNGVTALYLSPNDSLELLAIDDNWIEASTSETDTTEPSVSEPVKVTVTQVETMTRVSTPSRFAAPGETVPFEVRISPVVEGAALPVGKVELYENGELLDQHELTVQDEGIVTFDVQIPETASEDERTYRAFFTGTDKQAASEGAARLTVMDESEIPPSVYVDVDFYPDSSYDVTISLDRFSVNSAVYHAQLKFDTGGDTATCLYGCYNSDKIDPSTVEEGVNSDEGITTYDFYSGTGVTFESTDWLAYISFNGDGQSIDSFSLISAEFFDYDGNPIEAHIYFKGDEFHPTI
ncbi:hypothetical protein COLU111180_03615 [Cohnella lubricantis]|uniref:Bacterial Ig-like domain-containing protein n=1 Tax=Cohnella lubricantis TaxID=2163172 RepID=A0A841TC10_9BACL|nr:hypothetical protein [Cohnella lubricantis]MBB6676770.1 hypothetical protein [Cohnella lubricantis]MBP2117816.1 hypothetical protein [Cohnella lubricantis]